MPSIHRPLRPSLVLSLSLVAAAALADNANAPLDPTSRLRFEPPISVPAEEARQVVAAQADPLSGVTGLHIYVQGGKRLKPAEVKLNAPYCRVDIDATRLEAEGGGLLPVSQSTLVLSRPPMIEPARKFGDTNGLDAVGGTATTVVEVKWAHTPAEANAGKEPYGTALQILFTPESGRAVQHFLCVKKGNEPPTQAEIQKVFGKRLFIEHPVDETAAADEAARKEAAERAKKKGETTQIPGADAQAAEAAPKDRLKEYEDARKSKKAGPPKPKGDAEWDDVVKSVPAGEEAKPDPNSKQGVEWLGGALDADKNAKSGKKKKK